MKKYRNTFSVISLFFFINSFSQQHEIKVKFIGNCGLYLTDGNLNVYVDFPYKSGAHKYMKYDKSELDSIKDNAIFIFTHRHNDHYSKRLLKKHKGKKYGNWNARELSELNGTNNDFSIQALKTPHKFTFKHYSYVISWHNKKIYFSGDTGDLEELGKLRDLDWVFINPWLFMNAKAEKLPINTKMFAMYHLYPDQKISGVIPDNLIILKEQKKTIVIPY